MTNHTTAALLFLWLCGAAVAADVNLNGVDGMAHVGNNLAIVLLGMSFLNRMEMKRDGDKMVLTKRF